MCHDSFSLELHDRVNFITGQNGSGKSAFLTALCVAFGIKAKGTQRASTLKDFIKNGQSYGGVTVEIRNEGGDAFKPAVYGKVITIERRLTQSGQGFNMKDERGRSVAHKREDLQELLDHFNIEVENPCVIMSQDKSREFLHSGSGKDKFKFFFKATLLQQVEEVLDGIKQNIDSANGIIEDIKEEMKPYLEELNFLEDQIKNAQFIDQLTQRKVAAKKKLVWAWVYSTEKKFKPEEKELAVWRTRERRCREKINRAEVSINQVREAMQVKSAEIQQLLLTVGQLKNSQQALERELAEAIRERAGLDEDMQRKRREIQRNTTQVRRLEQQVQEMLQKHAQHTQAEAIEREQRFAAINQAIESKKNELRTLKEEETALQGNIESATQQVATIRAEIDDINGSLRDVQGSLRRLQEQRQNQMTTFGGQKVIHLLQIIEQRYREFSTPPIGPIGNHLTLVDASWSLAIELAVGKLLDAFIVANHKDMLLLRQIASRVQYGNLQIIIYDFNAGPLQMRPHQLPDPSLVTVKSVLLTESVVVMNTLIDQVIASSLCVENRGWDVEFFYSCKVFVV
jgi:chromosome segregation ATPase